jgi:hypothetical protein
MKFRLLNPRLAFPGMNRMLVFALLAWPAIAQAQTQPKLPPVIVVIGVGETPLGVTTAGAGIVGGLVEDWYVSSHNKENRRYSQRAFDALRATGTARLEEAARSAFGCKAAEPDSDACKQVFVWPIERASMKDADATQVLQERGWPTALVCNFWIQGADEGIQVRGFVQRFPATRRDTKELLPLGYIDAAPADVMKAVAGRRKPGDWLMENYWLKTAGTGLVDIFSVGMKESTALLDYVYSVDGSLNPDKLSNSSKRRDQLRYYKAQGFGCKSMLHCNSVVLKQFPSRLWTIRAAVGYANTREVVSEPIMLLEKK